MVSSWLHAFALPASRRRKNIVNKLYVHGFSHAKSKTRKQYWVYRRMAFVCCMWKKTGKRSEERKTRTEQRAKKGLVANGGFSASIVTKLLH